MLHWKYLAIILFCLPIVSSRALRKKPRDDYHPEEGNKLLEGDIIPNTPLNRTTKTSIKDEDSYWINGIVPYTFDDDFESDQIEILKKSIKELEESTCIKFRAARDEDEDFLNIQKQDDEQCSSKIGRQSGETTIKLGDRCFLKPGTIIHELIHSLCFTHEQNRHDRDDYVKIHWDNIKEEYHENFRLRSEDEAATYGVPYDYNSIMHYSDTAWAIDKDYYTIEPLVDTEANLGQRDELSQYDIKKINLRYHCTPKFS